MSLLLGHVSLPLELKSERANTGVSEFARLLLLDDLTAATGRLLQLISPV